MGKLYVAYGSNLNLKQMAYRCPSASIYGTGQLTNWELLYRGSATNSHATIAKKHGSYVPVLLWNIEPEDEKRLDIYEGYPRYYYKQNVIPSPSKNGGSSIKSIPSWIPAEDDLISANARITDNVDLTFSPPDFERYGSTDLPYSSM